MNPIQSLATLCLVSLSLPAMADTFTLKDGTKLEASIISETADAYMLSVQVTKSIKDEKKVMKADVVKVDAAQLDLIAFEPLAKLLPVQDLLTDVDYTPKIAAVEKFIKDFPTSPKQAEAKDILEKLNAEAALIVAGGVKLKGNIITKAEYKLDAYDLDAKIQETKFRNFLSSGQQAQLVKALRAFNWFDQNFQNTLSHKALLPDVKKAMQMYALDAKQQLASLDKRMAERKANLERMPASDMKATEAAQAQEAAAIEARYQSEGAGSQNWVTTSPFHRESLEATVSFATTEIARISQPKTYTGVDGGKAFRDALTRITSKAAPEEIEAAMTVAKEAGLPPRYIAALEAAAKAAAPAAAE